MYHSSKLEENLSEYISRQRNVEYSYVKKFISTNAFVQFSNTKSLNELVADTIVLIEKSELRDLDLERLIKEVLFYDGNAK